MSSAASITYGFLSKSPALYRTISVVGRGGAVLQSTSANVAANFVANVSAGGAAQTSTVAAAPTILGLPIPPEGRAVIFMATAMAMHYLGYSFARPSTIALFTSKKVGFQSPAAFPFAMAFISPMSLCLLLLYGFILEHLGPRVALIRTTVICASVLLAAAVAITILQDQLAGGPSINIFGSSYPLIKLLVGALFIFRESYVQLLTSQHWSFIASTLNPSQSTTWFAPISGLTSILSATAGLFTSKLVDKVGLTGVIACAGLSLLLSLIMSEQAYAIAEKVCSS